MALYVAVHRSTTLLIKHLSRVDSETNNSSAYLSAPNQTPRQSKSMSNVGVSPLSSKGNINVYLRASNENP